jgi:hypothetical protein
MKRVLLSACALVLCAGAANAQVWTEVPDAPAGPPPQITVGVGPLIDITGTLMGFSDVDSYCILITDPMMFGAWTDSTYTPGTLGPASTAFDSQLWLFDMSGMGVMHSDDTASVASGIGFGQPNPIAGPPPPPFAPGLYMLSISQYDTDALGPAGFEIWSDTPFHGWSGPDGPGAPGPIAGWTGGGGPGGPGGGDYHIVLSGATFCTIPTPSALALAGVGSLIAARRRR